MAEKHNTQLLKLLGIGFGIAATMGGTIGTGILRKPGPIAEQVGDPILILLLWLAVGFYAFLGVLCVIELAVSMPQAGSWYVYARRAFGNYFGFLTGFTSWMGTVAALGFGAYTFSEFISLLTHREDLNSLIAIGIIVFFTSLHLIGTHVGGKAQQFLTYTNAAGLILFVILCFTMGHSIDPTQLQATVERTAAPGMLAGIITALQAIFYTYDGWHTASYFSEENKDPAKTLPRSMIIGVLSIIAIYMLVNGAILYVVPIEQLAGTKLAASTAMGLLFGPEATQFVTVFLLISVLGILNSQSMFAPRVIYSMGRDGLFIKPTTWVNGKGTPWLALVLTTSLSVLLILSGKDTCGRLSDIATFFFVLSYTAGFVSLIRLRTVEPDLPRPYKVPFYPYLPILLTLMSLLFLVGAVYSDLNSSKYGLIFLIGSYPLYMFVKWINKKTNIV
ncbi:MAG: APC family permease [Saprospiraceae bacterium]|jgi:APA family basic amino acid/polyamine antiporter|nr:APC family permease [Saprospiraceae bacterium]MBP9193289.1 APC family permease [Saprospiraceae bacterium]